jgi:hypothetical protein
MGRRKQTKVCPISEDILKRLANIVGEESAAAKALECASGWRAKGVEVVFLESNQNTFIVMPIERDEAA